MDKEASRFQPIGSKMWLDMEPNLNRSNWGIDVWRVIGHDEGTGNNVIEIVPDECRVFGWQMRNVSRHVVRACPEDAFDDYIEELEARGVVYMRTAHLGSRGEFKGSGLKDPDVGNDLSRAVPSSTAPAAPGSDT